MLVALVLAPLSVCSACGEEAPPRAEPKAKPSPEERADQIRQEIDQLTIEVGVDLDTAERLRALAGEHEAEARKYLSMSPPQTMAAFLEQTLAREAHAKARAYEREAQEKQRRIAALERELASLGR